MAQHFESVDDYISSFPSEVQAVLKPHGRQSALRLRMPRSRFVERLVAQRG